MVKKNCPLFNGVKGTSRVDLFTEFFFLTEASFSPNPAIYTHREKKKPKLRIEFPIAKGISKPSIQLVSVQLNPR